MADALLENGSRTWFDLDEEACLVPRTRETDLEPTYAGEQPHRRQRCARWCWRRRVGSEPAREGKAWFLDVLTPHDLTAHLRSAANGAR